MNKELTPLEQIKELLQKSRETYRSENTNERDTIYALGEENAYVNVLNIAGHSLEDGEKYKKTLEILKEKIVEIKALKFWNKTYKGKLNYQNYLEIFEDCDLGEKLTEEEFDLLKEVLL